MFYKNKEYQTREITVFLAEMADENETIVIAPQSLSDDMGDQKEVEGTIEQFIDSEIYHYIDDDKMDATGEEICANLLDEVFEFICEGEEF